MSFRFRLLATASVLATPAAAQVKTVAFNGKPQTTLAEPFTRVGGVRELPGNKVVVSDVGEVRLLLADLAANSVKPIGRVGSGPGEYQLPFGLFAGTGNETWVVDPQLAKVHVISPDGKITSTLLPPANGRGVSSFLQVRGVDRGGKIYSQGSPGFNNGTVSDSVPLLRWNPKSGRIDTLLRVASGAKITQAGGGAMMVRMGATPFSAIDQWSVLPDGRLVMVRATPYRVDLIDANGKVQTGTPIAYTPIKVTAADKEAYREARKSARPVVRTFGSGGGGGNASPPPGMAMPNITAVADEEFPETKAPFAVNAVQVSPEGQIWVERSRAATDSTPTYDVFDGAGKLVAKVTLRPRSRIIGFGEAALYVARQDPDDDFWYVEKYARGSLDVSGAPLGGRAGK